MTLLYCSLISDPSEKPPMNALNKKFSKFTIRIMKKYKKISKISIVARFFTIISDI